MLYHVVLIEAAKTAAWMLPGYGGQKTGTFTEALNFEGWLWHTV